MPAPRIFVSSTCYDLGVVRSELRSFIDDIGYEPHMSEYSDLLFDPRIHTQTSCLQEIDGCDLLIVIIGRRFGGKSIPAAIKAVDFSAIESASISTEVLKSKENLSITQLEVLKAIEKNVPVFAFVDAGVLNDHFTYEKNKDKSVATEIEYPNVERQETARYIFEFINFIRHRSSGNSVIGFTHLDDIRVHLRKQWAALFQRLLYEQRFKREEARRIDFLANQIADIKTAIFASLSTSQLKDTARGAIQFRGLVDFVFSAARGSINARSVLRRDMSWPEILKELKIVEIKSEAETNRGAFDRLVLLLEDGTYFRARSSAAFISALEAKWEEFRKVDSTTKNAIIDALTEFMDSRGMGVLRHMPEQYITPSSKPREAGEEIEFA